MKPTDYAQATIPYDQVYHALAGEVIAVPPGRPLEQGINKLVFAHLSQEELREHGSSLAAIAENDLGLATDNLWYEAGEGLLRHGGVVMVLCDISQASVDVFQANGGRPFTEFLLKMAACNVEAERVREARGTPGRLSDLTRMAPEDWLAKAHEIDRLRVGAARALAEACCAPPSQMPSVREVFSRLGPHVSAGEAVPEVVLEDSGGVKITVGRNGYPMGLRVAVRPLHGPAGGYAVTGTEREPSNHWLRGAAETARQFIRSHRRDWAALRSEALENPYVLTATANPTAVEPARVTV